MSSQPYPRTWTEFLDQFSTEDACLAYLEELRWPNGFICSSCGVASVRRRPMADPVDVKTILRPDEVTPAIHTLSALVAQEEPDP